VGQSRGGGQCVVRLTRMCGVCGCDLHSVAVRRGARDQRSASASEERVRQPGERRRVEGEWRGGECQRECCARRLASCRGRGGGRRLDRTDARGVGTKILPEREEEREKKNYLEEKKKIFLSPYSLSAFLFFFSPRKSKLKQTTWVKPAHFKPGRIRPAPAKSTSPPPTQPSQPLAAPQRSSYMALPGGPSPTPPAAAAAPQPQVPPQRSSYMALPGGPSPTPPAAAPSGPGAPARRSSYLALPGGPGPGADARCAARQ
jgi:hypothetical protein